ncbi:MafI family immunity protein [Actinoplanes sp. NPDC051859]|uniref:MafI family immunity protein n=1 Tax=Actinoplanes sp. NPDC051859 TaxID=3363909 RepID=UPI00378BFE4A
MDFRQAQADILAVLRDSPIVRDSVVANVREFVQVGEIGHAFDTLCSWLYEDELPISRALYQRLSTLSAQLEMPEPMDRLDELIRD